MEVYNAIIQAIGSLGFPIVAYLLMVKEMRDEREKHAEESKSTAAAIANNTEALIRLCDKLDKEV